MGSDVGMDTSNGESFICMNCIWCWWCNSRTAEYSIAFIFIFVACHLLSSTCWDKIGVASPLLRTQSAWTLGGPQRSYTTRVMHTKDLSQWIQHVAQARLFAVCPNSYVESPRNGVLLSFFDLSSAQHEPIELYRTQSLVRSTCHLVNHSWSRVGYLSFCQWFEPFLFMVFITFLSLMFTWFNKRISPMSNYIN